jgi:hypothetical protein
MAQIPALKREVLIYMVTSGRLNGLGWHGRLFGLKVVRDFIEKEVAVFLRHLDETDSYPR